MRQSFRLDERYADMISDHPHTYPGVANPLVELDGASGGLGLKVGGFATKTKGRHFGVGLRGLNVNGDEGASELSGVSS